LKVAEPKKTVSDQYDDHCVLIFILIIQKLIENAGETVLKAKYDKKHFEDKYKAEKAKVDTANDAAKVLEEEFTVSHSELKKNCDCESDYLSDYL